MKNDSSIDEPPLTTTPSQNSSSAPKTKFKFNVWVFIFILFIIAITIIAQTLLYQWRLLQDYHQQSQTDIKQIVIDLNSTQLHLATVQQQIQEQETNLNKLRTQAENNEDAATLVEVALFIERASQLLYFQQYSVGATQLLERADLLLANRHNLVFRDLRAQLANVITQLKSNPTLDKEGLLLNLSQVMQDIPDWPLASQSVDNVQSVDQQKLSTMPAWKQGLIRSWQRLKSLVLIQYHEDRISRARVPQSRAYLDGYLQSQASMTLWAIMANEQTLYNTSLNQLMKSIKLNYALNDPKVTTDFASLQKMTQVNLVPNYPDLQTLLNSVKELQNQRVIPELNQGANP